MITNPRMTALFSGYGPSVTVPSASQRAVLAFSQVSGRFPTYASVAELADALGLGPSGPTGCGGSSPPARTPLTCANASKRSTSARLPREEFGVDERPVRPDEDQAHACGAVVIGLCVAPGPPAASRSSSSRRRCSRSAARGAIVDGPDRIAERPFGVTLSEDAAFSVRCRRAPTATRIERANDRRRSWSASRLPRIGPLAVGSGRRRGTRRQGRHRGKDAPFPVVLPRRCGYQPTSAYVQAGALLAALQSVGGRLHFAAHGGAPRPP
jgi:hypothetical protein